MARVLGLLRRWGRWGRWGAASGWRRALLACAALGCLLALAARAPARAALELHLAGASPRALAHYLADFSNHLHVYPDLDSWSIGEEWSNYTSWHYEVSYTCGARCWGRVALQAHDEPRGGVGGAGSGGQGAARHRLAELDRRCRHLPLLPVLCEDTESETLIEEAQDGGGAHLQESARAWCGALPALLARCSSAAQLRAARLLRLAAVRAALASPAA